MTPMCRQADSLLICLDIQESLLAAIPDPTGSRVLGNIQILLRAAKILDIPVARTEKFPAGLGHTHRDIKALLPETTLQHEKDEFSCGCDSHFVQSIQATHKRQAILTGLESHICVLQTALELREDGFEVFVADDAVCSKRVAHWKSALDRMRQAGIIVAPTESVLYGWLRDASHEQFRQVSSLLQH